jgi:hypothetical protein
MFNLLQEANRVTDGTVEIEDCMQTCACDDICVCMDACDGDEACIEECDGNPDWDLETHEDCVSDCGGDYDQYAESCPNCGYTSVDERDAWLRELGNRADEIEGYIRYVLQIQREYGLDTWMGY